jgi:SAM-dependent methyltransferase
VSDSSGHYDIGSGYWAGYSKGADESARLDLEKFADFVHENDVVLDFGCGSGYMLRMLAGREKIGIEPGLEAADFARSLGLIVHSSLAEVESESVDVAVSNHVLEHTLRPLDDLQEIRRVLRPGGRLVLVVPIDDWRNQRVPSEGDVNHHLYTWTPLLLGNLLTEAGFRVQESRILVTGWRHGFGRVKDRSEVLYAVATRVLAVVTRRRQIRVVATR